MPKTKSSHPPTTGLLGLSSIAVLSLVARAASGADAGPPPAASTAKDIVIDTHADTTQAFTYHGVDISRAQPGLQLDLIKAQQGGLDGQFFSIFVMPRSYKPEQFFNEALRQIGAVEKLAAANPTRVRVARTAADVRANADAHVLSALLGVEGGHALLPGDPDGQLQHLREFARRGVRYMTLTWSNSNDLGGSSGDDGDSRGLTPFGSQVIKEMNRLGIIVDVSHLSDPMFWDALRTSERPVLASHSSSRALTNIPRNMTDAMMKAVAKNGGAVCVNFGSAFLDDDFHRKEAALWKKARSGPPVDVWTQVRAEAAQIKPQVTLARLVDHIAHAVEVAGAEHVCLGSDFDGVPVTPVGLENVSKLPALAAALRARGLGPTEVSAILGGNVLRVLQANEPAAPPARSSPVWFW
ncbi:MAG: rane dipeptidase [Myxococcales bacterium]|jgi:membrane dipeptidase|nr:rane dipeptidase [Myxococcales bacterium]